MTPEIFKGIVISIVCRYRKWAECLAIDFQTAKNGLILFEIMQSTKATVVAKN